MWGGSINSGQYLRLIQNIISFFSSLRQIKYDLVIDLQGLLRTNIFMRLAVSKKRISLGAEFAGSFFSDEVVDRDHKSRRISSEYLGLAKHLKLESGSFKPRFEIRRNKKYLIFDRFKILKSISNNFFVISPFTTRQEKHWKNIFWRQLVESLTSEYRIKCLVLGNGLNGEQKKLMDLLDNKVISLVGKTTLTEAAEIINLSNFVVGVDTGLTHMSISLQKPTVALFGNTCPYLDPVNENAKVIWENMFCKSCKDMSNQNKEYTCLNGIYPDLVISTISKIYRENY